MRDLIDKLLIYISNENFILSILPFVFPIIIILYIIRKFPSNMKSRDIYSIFIHIIVLGFVIVLCIIYKNLLLNNEFIINKYNFWVIVLILLYIALNIITCLIILRKKNKQKIILVSVYFIIVTILPLLLIYF